MATATPLANGGVPPTSGGANAAAAAGVQPSAAGGAAATSPATRRQDTTPLSAVVKDAVRRWYEDALREAERGDVVSWVGAGAGAGAGGRARCFRDPLCPLPTFCSSIFPAPLLLSNLSETAGPALPDADRGVWLHARPGRGGAVGGPRPAAGVPHGGRILHNLTKNDLRR